MHPWFISRKIKLRIKKIKIKKISKPNSFRVKYSSSLLSGPWINKAAKEEVCFLFFSIGVAAGECGAQVAGILSFSSWFLAPVPAAAAAALRSPAPSVPYPLQRRSARRNTKKSAAPLVRPSVLRQTVAGMRQVIRGCCWGGGERQQERDVSRLWRLPPCALDIPPIRPKHRCCCYTPPSRPLTPRPVPAPLL